MPSPIIVHRAEGVTGAVMRHRYTTWDAASGEVTTEVWGCLYSELPTVYATLKSKGAQTISPSPEGAVVTLTATFGTAAGSGAAGGGGSGGGTAAITTRWSSTSGIEEIDLARIREWGIDDSLSDSVNKDRAAKISLIDSLIAKGKADVVLADPTLNLEANAHFLKYAKLRAAGYTGAQRARYTIIKTTTWASRSNIDAYLNYSKQWSVTTFAGIGAPIKEPKFKDIGTDGSWDLVPYEWLWLPPDSDVIQRSWTLVEKWLGAYKWKKELYDGGTG